VGILGMAFKAECDDIRDSLSYKLGKILRFEGANVLYSDEYVTDPAFVSKEQLCREAEVIIVGVPHKAYATVNIPASTKLIDLWKICPQSGVKKPEETWKLEKRAPHRKARSRNAN
jgi:UDP-N-acetyl-D-mannosaminuronic acid dehydrogenase